MSKTKAILGYGLLFGFLMLIVSCIWDMVFDHLTLRELWSGPFWHYFRAALIAAVIFGLIVFKTQRHRS